MAPNTMKVNAHACVWLTSMPVPELGGAGGFDGVIAVGVRVGVDCTSVGGAVGAKVGATVGEAVGGTCVPVGVAEGVVVGDKVPVGVAVGVLVLVGVGVGSTVVGIAVGDGVRTMVGVGGGTVGVGVGGLQLGLGRLSPSPPAPSSWCLASSSNPYWPPGPLVRMLLGELPI